MVHGVTNAYSPSLPSFIRHVVDLAAIVTYSVCPISLAGVLFVTRCLLNVRCLFPALRGQVGFDRVPNDFGSFKVQICRKLSEYSSKVKCRLPRGRVCGFSFWLLALGSRLSVLRLGLAFGDCSRAFLAWVWQAHWCLLSCAPSGACSW